MKKEASSSEFQLNRWDRKVGDLRMIIKDAENAAVDYRDSAMAYEMTITLGSQEIKDYDRKTAEIQLEISGMLKKWSDAGAVVDDLRARADISKMEALTASEKMKQISAMIEDEEKKMEELGKLLEKEMVRKSRWSASKGTLQTAALGMDHKIKAVSTNLNLLTLQCKEADVVVSNFFYV